MNNDNINNNVNKAITILNLTVVPGDKVLSDHDKLCIIMKINAVCDLLMEIEDQFDDAQAPVLIP